MTTFVPPKVSTQFIFYTGLVQQASPLLLKSTPTLASGDFKVSIDGGALANLGTLPTNTPASSVMVKCTLSTSEMAGANATFVALDAAGAEWCDQLQNFQTASRQVDDLAYPATSGRSMVVDASGLVDANTVKLGPSGSGTAQTARDVGLSVLLSTGTGTGQLDFTSGVVKANAVQLLGTAWLTPSVAGTPDVNTKTFTTGLDFTAAMKAATLARVTLTDTVTTYTGNTPQTGDSFARIGLAGVGLTNLGDARIANLDATVSSRMATFTLPTNFSALAITAGGAVTAGTVSDKTGYSLTAAYDAAKTAAQAGDAMTLTGGTVTVIALAVWATVIDGTNAAAALLRGYAAALLGKASGLSTGAPVYRNTADSKNVISATTDADGNRTAVTLDLS